MKKLFCFAVIALWVLAMAQPGVASAARSGGGGFVGVVTGIGADAKVISVRGGGKTVSFDASNPVLKGFRKLEDVKRGTTVSIAYTAQGVRIMRASLAGGGSTGPAVKEPVAKAAAKKTGLRGARVHVKGTGFRDVDENKDGKVTAVELSVIYKDLTMMQFKEYDKNGDGALSESEFRAATGER